MDIKAREEILDYLNQAAHEITVAQNKIKRAALKAHGEDAEQLADALVLINDDLSTARMKVRNIPVPSPSKPGKEAGQ